MLKKTKNILFIILNEETDMLKYIVDKFEWWVFMSSRAYIENFLTKYDYDEYDTQYLIDTYEKVASDSKTCSLFDKAMEIYNERIDCDYKKIIEIADEIASELYLYEFTVEFLVFVCLSERAEKVYEEKGIAKEIFYANMYDLKYKLEECKLVYNIIGTCVAYWFEGFFNLTRFTFERLQFEIIKFNKDYNRCGRVLTPDSKVVNVHIPRSLKPLDENSCDKSFMEAAKFFKDEFEGDIPFYCSSWLLYPENKKILHEKSNTYKFMSRFEIISEGTDKAFDSLKRIFDTMEKNPDRLPENTKIQKAYKAHLQNGGKIGYGAGVFFVPRNSIK